MEIIDTQLNTWEPAPPPDRPWDRTWSPVGPMGAAFTNEDALVAMDAVGVDAAVLSLPDAYREQLPNGLYRYDTSYGEEATLRYPGRFAQVATVEHRAPDLDDQVARLRERPGVLGIRVKFARRELWQALVDGEYDALFASAARHQVPVFVAIPGHPDDLARIAREFDELQLIVDHFGMVCPPTFNDWLQKDPHPLDRIPLLLSLAEHPNVAVKWGNIPRLSLEPYPYRDVWPHLHKVLEAFGVERCMFASDWATARHLHSYADSVYYLRESDRLSPTDKEHIFSITARRLLRWPKEQSPAGAAAPADQANVLSPREPTAVDPR